MDLLTIDGTEFAVTRIDFDHVAPTGPGVDPCRRTAWLIGEPAADRWVVSHFANSDERPTGRRFRRIGARRLEMEIALVGRRRHEIAGSPLAVGELQIASSQLLSGTHWRQLEQAHGRGPVHLAAVSDVLFENATSRRRTLAV